MDAPQPLLVNGKLAPAADFFGLTDLPPGEVVTRWAPDAVVAVAAAAVLVIAALVLL